MSRRDLAFDSETLRAELDARWPDAVGARRAATDETHRLALVHPEYDGFITLQVTARSDVDGVFLVPDTALEPVLTAHHRIGPLARGQSLPIDLELHPGVAARAPRDGWIRIVDAGGSVVAPSVRVTIATHDSLDCVLAGAIDGPYADAGAFGAVVDDLLEGRASVRRIAHRIETVAHGGDDPGPGRRRLRWGAGR